VISGIIIAYTKWYILDAIVSILVIIIILRGTWSLLIDSFRLSLDAVPANIDLNVVAAAAEKVAGVKGFHHIHIWAMSTTENALTAHLVVENNLDNMRLTAIKNELRHQLQHLNIQHITLETEFQNEDCEPKC
jgi:cobalt-zinc-cadmium efflux system protein